MFGGFGNLFGGNNCMCTLIWIFLLLQMCGCEMPNFFGNCGCKEIILLLLLLTCNSGCQNETPCGR